ncbi:hypothetical protein MIR68_003887 [Amoeboaphelidium protococcarum]|nr:hypothetical protein MIR68_003887 [Amoeboaphelidium protococcarum]
MLLQLAWRLFLSNLDSNSPSHLDSSTMNPSVAKRIVCKRVRVPEEIIAVHRLDSGQPNHLCDVLVQTKDRSGKCKLKSDDRCGRKVGDTRLDRKVEVRHLIAAKPTSALKLFDISASLSQYQVGSLQLSQSLFVVEFG